MREYAKISCSIWNSQKWRRLKGCDDAKLLYFYLHTCPHVNMVGCFILPVGYAVTDLGWPEGRYRQALDSLCTASLIGWEEAENLVRIVDFIKHDPFTNPSHAAGAVKAALALPDCAERSLLINDLIASKHVRAHQLPADIGQPVESLSRASQEPVDTPEPEPNQSRTRTEPEQEPDSGGGGGMRATDFSDDDVLGLIPAVLSAMGADPVTRKTSPKGRKLGGVEDQVIIARWLADGLTGAEIVATIEECAATAQSPPNSLKYFDKAMARLIDAKATPSPNIAPKGHANASASSRDRLGPILSAALARAKPV